MDGVVEDWSEDFLFILEWNFKQDRNIRSMQDVHGGFRNIMWILITYPHRTGNLLVITVFIWGIYKFIINAFQKVYFNVPDKDFNLLSYKGVWCEK